MLEKHSPSGVSPGDRLGAFEVMGTLGQGGSGTVYAARIDGREVALKIPRSDLSMTERETRRFLDEARHLARARHPHIIEVIAYGRLDDGTPYLAMPLLRGQTLAEHLSERGRLPLHRALELFEKLADAVDCLHRMGLVHRDIKPENVFLVEGGEDLKLFDLGIAKEQASEASTMTLDGFARGTPATMAPERFFGAPANAITDVYELAVVLYTMIVGALPWSDSSSVDSRLNPEAPSERDVVIPEMLESELLRALSTRPERRHPSVLEFAAAVRIASRSERLVGRRMTSETPIAVHLNNPTDAVPLESSITGSMFARAYARPIRSIVLACGIASLGLLVGRLGQPLPPQFARPALSAMAFRIEQIHLAQSSHSEAVLESENHSAEEAPSVPAAKRAREHSAFRPHAGRTRDKGKEVVVNDPTPTKLPGGVYANSPY